MENTYEIYDTPITSSGIPACVSRTSIGRVARYQNRTVENVAMTILDIQSRQVISSQAIASHTSITAMAKQAAEMYPEAADRFHSLAVQNYCHISQIIDDSMQRRW